MKNMKKLNIVCADKIVKDNLITSLKKDNVFKNWTFFQIEENDEIDNIVESRKSRFDKGLFNLKQMNVSPSINIDCIFEITAVSSCIADDTGIIESLSKEQLNKLNAEVFREYKSVIENRYELESLVYIHTENSFFKTIDLKIDQMLKNYNIPYLQLEEESESIDCQIKKIKVFLQLEEDVLVPEEVE